MIDIPEEKINEIAKGFYYAMYGRGRIIPRIAIKVRLGLLFGKKYFEKDYIENLINKDKSKKEQNQCGPDVQKNLH
jgi:hypothetical protein